MSAEPTSADRGAKRGWAGAALLAAAFVLIALLVLPGFLAAWFSRSRDGVYAVAGAGEGWSAISIGASSSARCDAELAILAPANWVCRHSESIRRFYMWEYRAGGGYDPYTDLWSY
ncbi:MAG TPA: hypothetical protein VG733_19940 [Chthoniobacteraceae bacterium]|nr:hypothetical protein [Chthoniobacteraceae bacterium]